MLTWIILAFIVLFVLFLVKAEHHFNRFKIIAILLILVILYFSITIWFGSSNADLTSPKGVVNSIYLYFGWLGDKTTEFFSLGKDTVTAIGNVIKGNSTTQKTNDGRR